MDLRPTGLQGIHRPVPAVRRREHHLRCLTRAGHHRRQRVQVVGDPHRLKLLTTLRGAHDHRSPVVQVDPDEL
jgi:hypothetical protein